jgi:hypothetical protein
VFPQLDIPVDGRELERATAVANFAIDAFGTEAALHG